MGLLSKIQGSLLGVMLGDTLGMPWEMLEPAQILQLTQGQGVVGFCASRERLVSDTRNLPLGSTTDDWQLTQAILTSLTRRRGFDLTDMALAHVECLQTSVAGWGTTTQMGISELHQYFTSFGSAGRSPLDWPKATPGLGVGNGVAMKISPIPLLLAARIRQGGLTQITEPTANHAFNVRELQDWVVAIGRLTHSDFRATVAAYAVASILLDIVIFDLFKLGDTPAEKLTLRSEVHWLLTRTIEQCRMLEQQFLDKDFPEKNSDSLSGRLINLLSEELLFGPIEELRNVVGTSCLALQSVPFAIAVFLRQPRDFRAGVLEAINSGGDTDTIAALVGSLSGAVVGLNGIPDDWKHYNPQFQDALLWGERLYHVQN